MKRLLGLALLCTLMIVGLSCVEDITSVGPGILKVKLISPHSGLDSAIVLTITGPAPLTSADPGSGLRLFQQPLGGDTTRFVLTGLLINNQTILTIGVPEAGVVGQYAGTVDAVAQPNFQVRALSGYALSITR